VLSPLYGSPPLQAAPSVSAAVEYSRCKCNTLQAQKLFDNPEHKPEFHDPGRCPAGKHDIIVSPGACMSIVSWARNALVKGMAKSTEFALFIDADMVIEVDTIDRLVAHDVDIVAGLCTKRTDPAIPNMRAINQRTQAFEEMVKWDETRRLIEVPGVGTGVMMIKRHVLEEVAEAFHPHQFHHSGDGRWFELLSYPHLDAEAGEDIAFCIKARRCGFKVWVDTSVRPQHLDYYGYTVEDFFPYQAQKIEQARAAHEKEEKEFAARLVAK